MTSLSGDSTHPIEIIQFYIKISFFEAFQHPSGSSKPTWRSLGSLGASQQFAYQTRKEKADDTSCIYFSIRYPPEVSEVSRLPRNASIFDIESLKHGFPFRITFLRYPLSWDKPWHPFACCRPCFFHRFQQYPNNKNEFAAYHFPLRSPIIQNHCEEWLKMVISRALTNIVLCFLTFEKLRIEPLTTDDFIWFVSSWESCNLPKKRDLYDLQSSNAQTKVQPPVIPSPLTPTSNNLRMYR